MHNEFPRETTDAPEFKWTAPTGTGIGFARQVASGLKTLLSVCMDSMPGITADWVNTRKDEKKFNVDS